MIYSNTLLDITSSQTWNSTTVVNQNITVESGATLTINAPTYLNQSTIFDIKSGGTLIVNTTGSILGNCTSDNIWWGTFDAELGSSVTIDSW